MPTATEDDVWDLVDSIDFNRPKAEVQAQLTLRIAPTELRAIRDKERELQMRLRDAALEHEDKPEWVSEDGMAESAGAVIAKGRAWYYEVLDDLSLYWAEEYRGDGTSPLSYYLPFRSDYAKVTDRYYRNRGERIAEKYVEVKEKDKYADSYQEAATTLYHLLNEASRTLRGNNHYDAAHMIDLAEKLQDDVDPRHVRDLARDYQNYRQGYYNT